MSSISISETRTVSSSRAILAYGLNFAFVTHELKLRTAAWADQKPLPRDHGSETRQETHVLPHMAKLAAALGIEEFGRRGRDVVAPLAARQRFAVRRVLFQRLNEVPVFVADAEG